MGIYLIITALLGIIPAAIAKKKGRNKIVLWWFYGWMLFIIALIHTLVMEDWNKRYYKERLEHSMLDNYINNTQEDSILEKNKNEKIIKEISDTLVTSEKNCLVDINVPVRIVSYEIKKKSDGGFYVAVVLLNTASKKVSAIKMLAKGYDSFGDIVMNNGHTSFPLLIQDLKLEGESYKPHISQISLPSENIRKINFEIERICFEDGEIVEYHEHEYKKVDEIEWDDNALLAEKIAAVETEYNELREDKKAISSALMVPASAGTHHKI